MEQISIPKTAALTYGLPAILRAFENVKEPTIFACDIMRNSRLERYWPAATVGECTPIAYDRPETAMAFFEMLEHTATSGRNFDYAAQLLVNVAPCKILMMFTRMSAHAPTNENIFVRQIPESMPFNELIQKIGTAIQETGARLVIVDDLAGYAKDNCRNVLVALDVIAQMRDVLLLAGIHLLNEDSVPSRYLAAHVHNLWQLTTCSTRMANFDGATFREQPYFTFCFGNVANPMREYFGLCDGRVVPVPCLRKLLRIKELAGIHAQEWISQKRFIDLCIGATGNEFLPTSIISAIQTAVKNGFILKTGNRKCVKLISADSCASANSNNDVVMTAIGNPYTSNKRTRQRKPLMCAGELRLLAPEQDATRFVVRDFMYNIIAAFVSGRKFLDFVVTAKCRNSFAFIVGGKENSAEWLRNKIRSFGDGAKFDCVAFPDITDERFLSIFKQTIEREKPDFTFILCIDRVKPNLYTHEQLIRELSNYTKSKNVGTVATSDTPLDRIEYNLADEYWGLSPLVRESDREDIFETHEILLPCFYNFKASVGDFDFLSRFKYDGHIESSERDELLQAFLTASFYFCNNTFAADIETDCTGNPLTRNVINQALHRGLIKIDYLTDKKNPLESRITFVGGRKKK